MGGEKNRKTQRLSKFYNTVKFLDLISHGELSLGASEDEILKRIYLNDLPIKKESGFFNYKKLSYGFRKGVENQNIFREIGTVSTFTSLNNEPFNTRTSLEYEITDEFDRIVFNFSTPKFFHNPGGRELTYPYKIRVSVFNPDGTRVYKEIHEEYLFTNSTYNFDIVVENDPLQNNNWVFPITIKLERRLADLFPLSEEAFGRSPSVFGFTTSPLTFFITYSKVDSRLFWQTSYVRVTEEIGDYGDYLSYRGTIEDDINILGYNTILKETKTYANYAVAAFVMDSRNFSGGLPKRSYLVTGRRVQVPSNFSDGDSYSGIWDGSFLSEKKYTNSPAWVIYDILTDKISGAGNFIEDENIDKFKLYEIAKYCAEEVDDLSEGTGTHKRFQANIQITKADDLYKVLSSFASIFHGFVFWKGGKISFFIDREENLDENPPIVINQANVVDGHFEYSSTANNTRFNKVICHYNDPDDLYKKKQIVVQDDDFIDKYGERLTEVTVFACTVKGQAIRYGRHLLYSLLLETELVTYKCGLDHLSVSVGEIVAIADEYRDGLRNGGRLIEVEDGSTDLIKIVSLDKAFTEDLSSAGYRLTIRLENDEFADFEIDSIDPDDDKKLTISYIAKNSTDTTSSISIYKKAIYMIFNTNKERRLFRIISIKEGKNNVYTVQGKQYNAEKYEKIGEDYDGEAYDFSNDFIGKEVPSPQEFTSSESLYKDNNKILTRLNLSWKNELVSSVLEYELSGSGPNDQSERIIYRGSDPFFTFNDVEAGIWQFSLVALGFNDNRSSEVVLEDLEVLGKSKVPADVENLKGEVNSTGVLLSWDKVDDIDLVGYRISSTLDGINFELIDELFIGTSTFLLINRKEEVSFYIVAEDTTGNQSEEAAIITVSVEPPPNLPDNDFSVYASGTEVTFSFTPLDEAVYYEIRIGDGDWEQAVYFNLITGPATQIFTSCLDLSFQIKAISAAGLYSLRAQKASYSCLTPVNELVEIDILENVKGNPFFLAGSITGSSNLENDGDEMTVRERGSSYDIILTNDGGDIIVTLPTITDDDTEAISSQRVLNNSRTWGSGALDYPYPAFFYLDLVIEANYGPTWNDLNYSWEDSGELLWSRIYDFSQNFSIAIDSVERNTEHRGDQFRQKIFGLINIDYVVVSIGVKAGYDQTNGNPNDIEGLVSFDKIRIKKCNLILTRVSINDSGEASVALTGDTEIEFNSNFSSAPQLSLQSLNEEISFVKVIDKDKDSFTIQLLNLSGNQVAGNVSWIANGY